MTVKHVRCSLNTHSHSVTHTRSQLSRISAWQPLLCCLAKRQVVEPLCQRFGSQTARNAVANPQFSSIKCRYTASNERLKYLGPE